MDNIQLQCTKYGHMQSPILLMCMNDKCENQNKLICLNCLGDHQQHIKELIQIGLINSQITQLRESIKQQMDNLYQKKQNLQKLIQESIENKFKEYTKQLLDFDNILKDFQNQKEAQGSEIYYRLASKLGNYCEIDSKQNQPNQSFLLLKQGVLKSTVHKCSMYFSQLLKLSYEINVEDKEKLDAFIKANQETLPEAHRVLEQIKVNDAENLKTKLQLKIQETVAQVGINLQYNTEITTSFVFNNEKQSFDKSENKQFVAQDGTISVDNFKKFGEAIKGFIETLEDEEVELKLVDNILCYALKGFFIDVQQKFKPISDYHKLDGEIETITHKEGQILIINYWVNQDDTCVEAMQKYVKMLNDHKEQWGQSVRLVALSLFLADECEEFMEEKKEWQNAIEYYFPKEQGQIDLSIYLVTQIPHYIIVDKFGIVRNVGSVKNLADVVNKLLAEQEQKQIEENNKQGLNQEQSQNLYNFFNSDQISQLTKDLGKTGVFKFSIQFQELFVQEGQTTKLIKYSKPKLTYFVRQNKLDLLNSFLDKIFSIAAKDSFEIKEEISKTINIPFPGIECVLCKKALGDKVQQYYSPFKNEFLCCECAEFDDKTQKGLKRYKYTDNLIFINAPLVDQSVLVDIDDYKIGKNLKIQPEEEGDQQHEMICNGKCKQQEEGPRYISVTARPGKLREGGYIDYCFGCFKILKNKESDQAKAIVAYDSKEGMTSDSLFLRVLFYLGYYEF